MDLKCLPGYVIKSIDFASYGMPSLGTCDHEVTGSCHAGNSLSVISGLCLNQTNCRVTASNSMFGDPCVGTVKHLTVKATCGFPNTLCKTVYEYNTMNLTCQPGYVISSIDFASYGSPSSTVCGNEIKSSCHASNSLNTVSSLCLHKNSCNVAAGASLFGDPCVGTYKRLTVRATCTQAEH